MHSHVKVMAVVSCMIHPRHCACCNAISLMPSLETQLVVQSSSEHSTIASGALEEPVVVAAPIPTLRFTSNIQLNPEGSPTATGESFRTRLLRCGNTGVFLAVFIINVVCNSGNVWPQLSVANSLNHPALLTPAGWVYSVRDMILFLQFAAVVCSSLPDTGGWKQGLEDSIGHSWQLAWVAESAWHIAFVSKTALGLSLGPGFLAIALAASMHGMARLSETLPVLTREIQSRGFAGVPIAGYCLYVFPSTMWVAFLSFLLPSVILRTPMLQMYSVPEQHDMGPGGGEETSGDDRGETEKGRDLLFYMAKGRDLLFEGVVTSEAGEGEGSPLLGIELLAVMMLVVVTVAALARVVRHRDVVYGITAVCAMAGILGGFRDTDFTMARTISSICFGVLQVASTWVLLQLFSDTQNGG